MGDRRRLPLPCDDREHWASVAALASSPIDSFEELHRRMSSYCRLRGLGGLARALKEVGHRKFWQSTLPNIVKQAIQLPTLHAEHAARAGPLWVMQAQSTARQEVPRDLGTSLLANMFLCTFDKPFQALACDVDMPHPSFARLLANDGASCEVAKLCMFINFFERVGRSPPRGRIIINRVVGTAMDADSWFRSTQPLLPLEVAPERVGFETAAGVGLAHADFANKYIGGGVLCGGCVQEEIRFSICPELCLSMLFSPRMEPQEAIQIIGAEQFSHYTGYMFKLRFGGDFVDESARWPDGTVQSAVLAMDALDLRGLDTSLSGQMSTESMLRELNKSAAAFAPVDAEGLAHFPIVATGNWGCGAFGGFAPLKALIQWASASQCGRRLRYFPFEQAFGPWLCELSESSVRTGVTVGQLLSALSALRPVPRRLDRRMPMCFRPAGGDACERAADLSQHPDRLLDLVSQSLLDVRAGGK